MSSPPPGYPVVTPYLLYQDAVTAVEYLERPFGFEQRRAQQGAAGRTHYELSIGDGGLVMMGQAGESFRSHAALDTFPPASVHVYVAGVDALHARARTEGADVTEMELSHVGDRRFTATDPE